MCTHFFFFSGGREEEGKQEFFISIKKYVHAKKHSACSEDSMSSSKDLRSLLGSHTWTWQVSGNTVSLGSVRIKDKH